MIAWIGLSLFVVAGKRYADETLEGPAAATRGPIAYTPGYLRFVWTMSAAVPVPFASVSGTDSVVYQGPPERSTVWPAGAVESAEIVSVSEAVTAAPLVATTV